MAKATATSEKPARLAKKKSQDLKAEAPVKAKKAKTVEPQPAAAPADPSSSKPKKAKMKSEDGAKEVAEPVKADAKKDRKKKESAVVVEQPKPDEKTEVSGEKKRKRKAAEPAEQETSAQPLKETKKKRASIAEPAPAVEEKKVETGDKKKKRKAKAAPEPQPQPEEEAEEAAEEQSEKEEEDEFYGFESDDDDSSDEDEMVDDIPGIDIGKLPTIARDDETVKRKLEKAKRKPTEDRGVIYLGRIPHGFYEDQMRAYFSQFGTVTRLRLSRNKKTGKPKHYGFVEFDSSSVAKIVAETMDNYLLMGHILTCKVIPKDQVHPELWVGSNKKWRAVPRDRVVRVAHNKPRTVEETARAEARLLKRQEQRKRKLEEAGIKYDFEAVAYKKKPKATEA